MQNKTAHFLFILGILLNMAQWVVVLQIFLWLKGLFGDYTIANPNVVNGSMQSFSFWDMLQSMVYSGVPINIMAFTVLMICMLYLVLTGVFVILEVVAYFRIRQNKFSWVVFILAMGIKNVVVDISGVPFLVAGLIMYKEKKNHLSSNK